MLYNAPNRMTPRLLVIPGLDGDPSLLRSAAPDLFQAFRPVWFDHRLDDVAGGIDGMAERALAMLDADEEAQQPAYVCGESFGSTLALTLAHRYPDRVRGLVLLSGFAWYPRSSAWSAQLGLVMWRVLGDRLTRPLLELWRPIGVPGALGWRSPPAIRRAYLSQAVHHLPGYRGKCEIVVAFDNNVAEPRGPNAVCEPIPPNAPAKSAAFPLCSKTTIIRKTHTTT